MKMRGTGIPVLGAFPEKSLLHIQPSVCLDLARHSGCDL